MDRVRKKNCFTRKTNFGKNPTAIYHFCVDKSIDKQSGTNLVKNGIPKPFCNAKKGSQGYDNISGYVYHLVVINGISEHLAYVECDYVK
jgi:hypothetical protein